MATLMSDQSRLQVEQLTSTQQLYGGTQAVLPSLPDHQSFQDLYGSSQFAHTHKQSHGNLNVKSSDSLFMSFHKPIDGI